MSKRAEEAALMSYPYQRATHFPDGFQEFDRNSVARTLFQEGYEQAEKDTIEKAVKWLKDRIGIPYSVATNEDGEPLADSYIDYAKKRLEAANEIVDDFRKVMEEE